MLNEDDVITLKKKVTKVLDLKSNQYDNIHDAICETGQSRTIRVNDNWILIYKTRKEYPDVIDDLQGPLAELDIEDIRYLDSLVLIGSKRSIKVDSDFVESMLGDKTQSRLVINRMKDELDRDFGYKIYDKGPHKRLGIRIPIKNINDYTDEYLARIKKLILNDGFFIPGNLGKIHSVYLITDDTYVRLEPDDFFGEIFDLKQNIRDSSRKKKQSSKIILGESPGELLELALKKLKEYDIYRDIRIIDAAGMEYHFDAVAVMGDDKVLINYIDQVTYDDLMFMKLYMDALYAQRGWILTSTSKKEESVTPEHTDNIQILTMKDL